MKNKNEAMNGTPNGDGNYFANDSTSAELITPNVQSNDDFAPQLHDAPNKDTPSAPPGEILTLPFRPVLQRAIWSPGTESCSGPNPSQAVEHRVRTSNAIRALLDQHLTHQLEMENKRRNSLEGNQIAVDNQTCQDLNEETPSEIRQTPSIESLDGSVASVRSNHLISPDEDSASRDQILIRSRHPNSSPGEGSLSLNEALINFRKSASSPSTSPIDVSKKSDFDHRICHMDNHGDDIYESYDFSYFNNMQENEFEHLLAEMKNDPVAQSDAGATLSQYDEPVLANHQTSTPFVPLQIDPQLLAIDRRSLGTNISNRRTSTPTAQPPIDPRLLDAKTSNQSTPIPISQAKIDPKLQNVFKLGAAASISQEELDILASDIAEGTIPDFTTFSNDLISNPTVQFESSAAGIPDLRPARNNPNYKRKDFSALASIPSIRFAQSVSGNSKQSTAPTPETRGHATPLVANTGILDQNTTPATSFRGIAGRGISKHNTRSQTGLPRSGTSNKKKSVSSNIADNNNFHQSLAPSRGLAGSGTLSQGRAPPSGRASSATSDQSVATLDSRGLAQNDANTAELARLKAELQEYKAKIARLEQEATKSQVSWKVDGPVNRSYPAQTRPTTSIRGQSTQLGAPPLPVFGVSTQNSPQSQLDPTTTRVNGPVYEEFVNSATSVNEPRATSDSAPAAEEAPKLWSKAAEAIARDRFEHDSNYSYEDWNQEDDIYNRSREDMMTTVVCSPDCGCPDKANHKFPNLGNTKFVM